MITPPSLQAGDRIGITATARKVSPEEMQPFMNVLRTWGFEPVVAPNLYGAYHQFSGTDDHRRSDLQHMLDDPNIKAIFIARGGYGTMRIIDNIDFSGFMRNPKWIAGFSDITVLHACLTHMGAESLHCAMPINAGNYQLHEPPLSNIKDILQGRMHDIEIASQTMTLLDLNRNGSCEGILAGGNLSLLYALQGSATEFDYAGKILFIEDLDEYLYHVDRMVLSLKRAGKLRYLAGLVVGGMSDMKDNAVPFGSTAEEIIREHVEAYDYPVVFGFPAGHIRNNLPLVMGGRHKLEVADGFSKLQKV
jgi:muramoyltetrapeptide carboxypeptidase